MLNRKQELKGDMRRLGSAVYQAYYEQQHIKQILNRQHRSIAYVSVKTKVFGYIEAFLIIACSSLQVSCQPFETF